MLGKKTAVETANLQKFSTDVEGNDSTPDLMITCCVPHITATAFSNNKLSLRFGGLGASNLSSTGTSPQNLGLQRINFEFRMIVVSESKLARDSKTTKRNPLVRTFIDQSTQIYCHSNNNQQDTQFLSFPHHAHETPPSGRIIILTSQVQLIKSEEKLWQHIKNKIEWKMLMKFLKPTGKKYIHMRLLGQHIQWVGVDGRMEDSEWLLEVIKKSTPIKCF